MSQLEIGKHLEFSNKLPHAVHEGVFYLISLGEGQLIQYIDFKQK